MNTYDLLISMHMIYTFQQLIHMAVFRDPKSGCASVQPHRSPAGFGHALRCRHFAIERPQQEAHYQLAHLLYCSFIRPLRT